MRVSKISKTIAVAALVGLTWSQAATAQLTAENSISASGSASIKKPPQLLRLHMELGAKAGSLKEALTKLGTLRAAAKKQLEELGAASASIEVGDAKVLPGKTDQRRQMAMMVRQRMKAGGKAASQPAQKELVTVSLSLTAEWPLKEGSAEDRLLFVQELQDKIKAADLGGQKEAQQLSAEEQELAEEEEAQMSSYMSEDEGPKFGEPAFLYVAKLTEEERAKGLADAFGKAKAEAGRLAAAAGVPLGTLCQLVSSNLYGRSSSYGDEWSDFDYSSNRAYYRLMQRSAARSADNPDEAIGVNPGSVSVRLAVQASFSIK